LRAAHAAALIGLLEGTMEARTMLIARRAWLLMIGTTLVASCRGAREPDQPPKPATVTLAVEGMT
jgi:hypothetical protein